jgi:hypothetical protein
VGNRKVKLYLGTDAMSEAGVALYLEYRGIEPQRKKKIYFELKIYLSTSLEEGKGSQHRDDTVGAIQQRTQTQDPGVRGIVSKPISMDDPKSYHGADDGDSICKHVLKEGVSPTVSTKEKEVQHL